MFIHRRSLIFVLVSVSLLPISTLEVPGAPPESAQARVFLVPNRAKAYEENASVDANEVTAWIKRGATLTAKVNVGLFFVDPGGALHVSGNCFRVVVADGGTLTVSKGNVIHVHHAKGARIKVGNVNVEHITKHDRVAIRQTERFTLTGMVRQRDGKPAASVKVHAFTLGQYHLLSESTDAQGRFTITTDEEVSSLVADLSANWADQKRVGQNIELDQRQRLSPVQGWETVIAHGPWTEKGNVELAPREQAKLRLEPLHVLTPIPITQSPYPQLHFSPDGSLLAGLWPEVMKGKADAQLWAVSTGKEVARLPIKPYWSVQLYEWAAFSPDGKLLALVGPDGIQLHKLPGGDKVLELPKDAGEHHALAFSPDSRLLAIGGMKEIAIWDLSKKMVRQRLRGHSAGTTNLAFSPDGKTLLTGGEVATMVDAQLTIVGSDKLRLWNLDNSKELGNAAGHSGLLRFSSSGLILSSGQSFETTRDGNTVRTQGGEFVILSNPATNRELLRLKHMGRTAVFTDDDRLIVTVGEHSTVHFWEVLTGQEVLAAPIPEYWTPCLALAPGGRMLATSRDNGAVVLWSLRWDHLRLPEEPLTFTDSDRDRLWKDLAGDAAGAYRTIWRLSQASDPAVKFLRERLQPIAAQNLPIKKWLMDLDSKQFAVRETALRELSKHGRVVETELREALNQKLPLEVQRRIQELLTDIDQRPMTPEELRQVRSIAALEWIGTQEARQFIKTLAEGWPAAMQTREAAATLRRMTRAQR